MNNIAGDKLMNYLYRVAEDHRPITADVFLTNYCNDRCPYCTYGRWKTGEKRAMAFDEFREYAGRLRDLGVQGIVLTGGGEPTLNPDFQPICDWLFYMGIHYGINTNFNRLEFPKPDFLKVSLDGWSEDSYEMCRGVRMYQKTVENIREYLEWRKKNSPHTSVGIQKVCESVEDVLRFYDGNEGLDVDYISFRPVESTAGCYYESEKAKLRAERIRTAVENLARTDPRVLLNYKWNMLDEQQMGCSADWAQIAVNEKGEVMYCCQKPYEIVGHIMDEDILRKKRFFKTDITKCDIPCRMSTPNKFVRESHRERKDRWFI